MDEHKQWERAFKKVFDERIKLLEINTQIRKLEREANKQQKRIDKAVEKMNLVR